MSKTKVEELVGDTWPTVSILSKQPINETDLARCSETSYRRGYFQGYYSALEDANKGYSFRRLYRFLESKLFDWRYRKGKEKVILPPEYKEKQK